MRLKGSLRERTRANLKLAKSDVAVQIERTRERKSKFTKKESVKLKEMQKRESTMEYKQEKSKQIQIETAIKNKLLPKTTIGKRNNNIDAIENWYEGLDPGLQPIVKQEPIAEIEEFEYISDSIPVQDQDIIEFDKVVKVEYDCEINELEIDPGEEERLNIRTGLEEQNDALFHSEPDQLQMLTLETKFSKRPYVQTNDEALGYIRLLETFALNKENFRLIGFVERLQNHFEKR